MTTYKVYEAYSAKHKDVPEIAVMGAAAGTAAGAGVGFAVGGPIGGAIGAVVGAISGGMGASATINDADDVAKQMENEISNQAGDSNV